MLYLVKKFRSDLLRLFGIKNAKSTKQSLDNTDDTTNTKISTAQTTQ